MKDTEQSDKVQKALRKLVINGNVPQVSTDRLRSQTRNIDSTILPGSSAADNLPDTVTTESASSGKSYNTIYSKQKEVLTEDEDTEKDEYSEPENILDSAIIEEKKEDVVTNLDTVAQVATENADTDATDIKLTATNFNTTTANTESTATDDKRDSIPRMTEHLEKIKVMATKYNEISVQDIRNLSNLEVTILLNYRIEHLKNSEKSTTDEAKKKEIKEDIKKLEAELNSAIELNKSMSNAQQAIIANATAPPPEEKHKLQKFIEIPKFSAKPTENFQQWVYENSKAIKILKYSDEDAFDIVGFKLSGGPYDTHRHFYEQHLKKNNIPNYSEFLKLLTIKYGNELEIQQAREKLLCLKMSNHGNDILRYNEAFDALISKIGYTEFSQNELLANYKHGLSQQIHKEINLRRANDLTEAISIAIQYSQLNSNDQYSMNYAGREIIRSYNNYIKKPA